MTPALDYMVLRADGLGLHSDMQFYWLSGTLSGVLDNAPTYLTFLAAAFGLEHLTLDNPEHMREFIAFHGHYLIAISLGSTCFGAMTYIGNGPNLMVKAIAEHSRVHTPSFFRLCSKVFRCPHSLVLQFLQKVVGVEMFPRDRSFHNQPNRFGIRRRRK